MLVSVPTISWIPLLLIQETCWLHSFKQYFLKINKTKPAILVEIPVNVWMLDFKLSWWAERNIIKVILSSVIAKLKKRIIIQRTRLHSPHPSSFRFFYYSANYIQISLFLDCSLFVWKIHPYFSFKLMNFSPFPINPLSLLPFPICSSQLPSICHHSNLSPH